MVKTVKYTSELSPEEGCKCAERLTGCEVTASLHVCFEDGSGISVCKSCFGQRANEGEWITDSSQTLLAS